MYSLLKRKIRLYPIVSVIVAGLVSGILMFESGMLYAPPAAPALVSSATQNQTTQPASFEQDQPAEVSTDNTHEDLILKVEESLVEETHRSIKGIEPRLAKLLAEKDFDTLRDELLKIASVAVAENNKVSAKM